MLQHPSHWQFERMIAVAKPESMRCLQCAQDGGSTPPRVTSLNFACVVHHSNKKQNKKKSRNQRASVLKSSNSERDKSDSCWRKPIWERNLSQLTDSTTLLELHSVPLNVLESAHFNSYPTPGLHVCAPIKISTNDKLSSSHSEIVLLVSNNIRFCSSNLDRACVCGFHAVSLCFGKDYLHHETSPLNFKSNLIAYCSLNCALYWA